MLRSYVIEISEEAQRDIIQIEDYITGNSPQNAEGVVAEIRAAIRSLKTMPDRCKIFENNLDPTKVVHSMTVRPFAVYYRITDARSVVEIITVRHGARDRPARFFR